MKERLAVLCLFLCFILACSITSADGLVIPAPDSWVGAEADSADAHDYDTDAKTMQGATLFCPFSAPGVEAADAPGRCDNPLDEGAVARRTDQPDTGAWCRTRKLPTRRSILRHTE